MQGRVGAWWTGQTRRHKPTEGGAGAWDPGQVRFRNAKSHKDKAVREHEAERARLAQLERAHEQLIDEYAAVEAALGAARAEVRVL